MDNTTAQFITQTKLHELHKQRDHLRESYRRLEEEAAAQPDLAQRLRLLYQRLSELNVAGQSLHPEVVNLELLFHEIEAGSLSADLLALWAGRLEAELEAGQVRSEVVYLFGALLEEWVRESAEGGKIIEESLKARAGLQQMALTPPAPLSESTVLEPLFAQLTSALSALATRLPQQQLKLREPVQDAELTEVLKQLTRNIYQASPLRREAQQFLENELLRKELADTLTIMVANLDSWNWPETGVKPRVVWTRNKWRWMLDLALPDTCLLELVAKRWMKIWTQIAFDASIAEEDRARLHQLLTMQRVSALRLMFQRGLPISERWDLGVLQLQAEASDTSSEKHHVSIKAQRENQQQHLRTIDSGGLYSEGYFVNEAVSLVHTELQLARAAAPDQAIYVVKVDLRDYYPSLSHSVLLTILRRLGLSEADLVFFQRYLAVPLALSDSEPPAVMQRGVPMDFTLSDMLGELVMRCLERFVRQTVPVLIVRLRDDICLMTSEANLAVAGWDRVHAFCTACGLTVNVEKSGAVCLGGALPAQLPQQLPRWGLLELNPKGEWQVQAEAFQAHLEQTRLRVTGARSILSSVQQYNANSRYLFNMLSMGARLGESHRQSVAQAVRDFHANFFGDGQSITAGLSARIRNKFLSDTGNALAISESWLYWPLTAGGLGLRNVLVMAGQYGEAYAHLVPPTVPVQRAANWERASNEWSRFYKYWLESLRAAEPKDTKVMKTLIDDFIARGKSLTAGKQKTLSSYWRWVLYTYGPHVLQQLGTFRFLITELVPLELIHFQLIQDASLDDRM